MKNVRVTKIFNTGQITRPGLYYENDSRNFGVNLPTGIEASKLAKELKKANKKRTCPKLKKLTLKRSV